MDGLGALYLFARILLALLATFILCAFIGGGAWLENGGDFVDAPLPPLRRFLTSALICAAIGFTICVGVGLVLVPVGVLRLFGCSWNVATGAGIPAGLLVLFALAWYSFEVRGARRDAPIK